MGISLESLKNSNRIRKEILSLLGPGPSNNPPARRSCESPPSCRGLARAQPPHPSKPCLSPKCPVTLWAAWILQVKNPEVDTGLCWVLSLEVLSAEGKKPAPGCQDMGGQMAFPPLAQLLTQSPWKDRVTV